MTSIEKYPMVPLAPRLLTSLLHNLVIGTEVHHLVRSAYIRDLKPLSGNLWQLFLLVYDSS